MALLIDTISQNMAFYEDLNEKVVLVTGGSGGLGREMVKAFHAQGCKVALNYNSSKDKAEETARILGSRVETLRADVADREHVRAMLRGIEDKWGPLDILVNNSGVSYPMEFENLIEEKMDRMWRINVLGPVNVSQEALPGMKRKGSGVIINIASHAGLGNPRPYGAFYAATKSALIVLSKRMALELGKYKIRVNAIAPGVIRVDPKGMQNSEEEELRFEEELGLRRILTIKGVPKHIADAALFLASKSSEFMTGQVITVDGGRLDSLPRSV
ncbi:MAG: SDR family oxidoreductase [Nitrososphaerales archaeon]